MRAVYRLGGEVPSAGRDGLVTRQDVPPSCLNDWD